MTITQEGLDLIKSFEGLKLDAYLDSVRIPTIGYGTTLYPPSHLNGRTVKLGDKISKEQAESFLKYDVEQKSKRIRPLITTNLLNDNQFSALVSFAYNLGEGALKTSTLLKRVNINSNDPSISLEFAKWINAGGKPLDGLKRRREAESTLYFKK